MKFLRRLLLSIADRRPPDFVIGGPRICEWGFYCPQVGKGCDE